MTERTSILIPEAGWKKDGMKLLKEGKEGQDDQSSNQELLNMLGGMNGQAKVDDTRQSRINIYQENFIKIFQIKKNI